MNTSSEGGGNHQPARERIGRYILCDEIAAGGMASVYFARLVGDVGFARTVAVKRLHGGIAKDPEFVSMFLDEARITGRIRHPHVVPTLDVVNTRGELFVVMEYVHGESLGRLFTTLTASDGRVPPDIAVACLSDALHGLHAAHEAKDEHNESLGIVHRDVSPQNILVGVDGVSRMLDFGVAKAMGRLSITRDGAVKGKLAYMAPEQLYGGELTRLADVYAAAVCLWEVLSGRRLFFGRSEGETVTNVLSEKVAPPSTHNPDVSPALDEAVMKGLSREPTERWQSAREFALALEKVGRASASEVGAWVEALAGPDLEERARSLAAVESLKLTTPASSNELMDEVSAPEMLLDPSMSTQPPPRGSLASLSGAGGNEGTLEASSLSSMSQDVDEAHLALEASRRRSLFGAVVVGVLLAAVALLLLATMRGGPPTEPVAATTASTPAPTAPATESAPAPTASAAPEASASAAPSATSTAPSTSTTGRSKARGGDGADTPPPPPPRTRPKSKEELLRERD
jgi:eukaryotic-like serine/threonine-protein kinase